MLRLEQEGSENERIVELQQQLEVAHRERSERETDTRYSQSQPTTLSPSPIFLK